MRPLFSDAVNSIYEAPIQLSPGGEGTFPTLGFPHVLNNVGYVSVDSLEPLVRAWFNLFDVAKTEIVIADHSPTAVLAAHIAGLRYITVGNGFELPPAHGTLPSFAANLTASDKSALDFCHSSVTANINAVLSIFSKPPLEMASDLYASAVRNLLLTFSETDHYGPRIETAYFGLPTEAAGVEPTWPSRPGKKVYASLKSSPGLKEFFSSLRQLLISLLVYHNALPRDSVEHCATDNIRFTGERLNLQTIADEADRALLNDT